MRMRMTMRVRVMKDGESYGHSSVSIIVYHVRLCTSDNIRSMRRVSIIVYHVCSNFVFGFDIMSFRSLYL